MTEVKTTKQLKEAMITIDGIRYISAKTYSELSGLSASSISNKKASLPFRHFDEINMDLLNFDLLELEDEVRRQAELRLATREQLPTYTAAQLGDYFVALITRLLNQASTADQLRKETESILFTVQDELAGYKSKAEGLESQLSKALADVGDSERKLQEATEQFDGKLDAAATRILALTEENKTLITENNGMALALKTLESVMSRVSSTSDKDSSKTEHSSTKKTPKSSKTKE